MNLKKEVIKLINELKEEYIKKYKKNFVSIVLFGSYANNLATSFSDIDLMIIFEKIRNSKLKIYTDFFSILENLPTYKKLKNKKIYLNFSPIIKEKNK
jgi:Nucleotidyltransferase domain.